MQKRRCFRKKKEPFEDIVWPREQPGKRNRRLGGGVSGANGFFCIGLKKNRASSTPVQGKKLMEVKLGHKHGH